MPPTLPSYTVKKLSGYGNSRPVISNPNAKYLSSFWVTLRNKMGTKLNYNTTCEPQTNGQTKVKNRMLGTLIRALINSNAKTWDVHLPNTEFAYDKAPSKSTTCVPSRWFIGLIP